MTEDVKELQTLVIVLLKKVEELTQEVLELKHRLSKYENLPLVRICNPNVVFPLARILLCYDVLSEVEVSSLSLSFNLSVFF